jgi:hypothetical protein
MPDNVDTHNRALQVNLDPRFYGTFAEIGAGQEVARWFLHVGGAAGTVAKTMSAYDMKFSDDIYGEGSRYVSRERILAMLDHEYALLIQRLGEKRGAETNFFVFANSVSARNYKGTNECHGWLGLRYQVEPQGEPNELLLHINMRDPSNSLQQEALGILGVNLLYTALLGPKDPDGFFASLVNELSLDRIEVDVIEARGPEHGTNDAYILGTKLVRAGLAQAVMLSADGTLVQPSDVIRKRPLVVERGMFMHTRPYHRQMLEGSLRRLQQEEDCERDPVLLPELSVNPVALLEAPDEEETLRRLRGLTSLNQPILLSRFPEVYHLTEYLRRYTTEPVRFVLGVSTWVQVLQNAQYKNLMGGMLEALGKLLAGRVKLHVYSMQVEVFRAALPDGFETRAEVEVPSEGLVTAENIKFEEEVQHLYRYLYEAGWVVAVSPDET